jgi:FtsP/CotA-like multicopper oxidase with cupredoxin domain
LPRPFAAASCTIRDDGRVTRLPIALAATALVALLAGCGGSSSPHAARAPAPRAPRPDPAQFLRVDSAHRAVRLTLIAGDGVSNNGFNFDGYGRGELLVSVPRGWRVTVRCTNHASSPNSCAVVSGPQASRPAFAGAATPHPVAGLQSGQSATFSFVASRVGSYRVASVVPGHEEARMYAVLEVSRGGRPSISARPGP